MTTIINPFKGYPTTHEGATKGGDKRYKVSLAATGPWGAKARDNLTIFSTVSGFVVAVGFAAFAGELPDLQRLLICISPAPTGLVLHRTLEALFANRAFVTFTPKTITVRKLLSVQRHDRSHNLKFTMRKHERAARFEKILEHRRANPDRPRRIFPEKNYYESSYRIYIEVLGQSYLVNTVFGLNRANRICARLNAIHQSVESFSGRGAGVALIASDDWAKSAGELS